MEKKDFASILKKNHITYRAISPYVHYTYEALCELLRNKKPFSTKQHFLLHTGLEEFLRNRIKRDLMVLERLKSESEKSEETK